MHLSVEWFFYSKPVHSSTTPFPTSNSYFWSRSLVYEQLAIQISPWGQYPGFEVFMKLTSTISSATNIPNSVKSNKQIDLFIPKLAKME